MKIRCDYIEKSLNYIVGILVGLIIMDEVIVLYSITMSIRVGIGIVTIIIAAGKRKRLNK